MKQIGSIKWSVGWMLALLLLALPLIAYAQAEGEVVAEGLNGPMGILLDPDGNIWVIDSGTGGDTAVDVVNPETGEKTTAQMGDTARVVMVAPDGAQSEIVKLPSVALGQETLGGARLALANGVLYATTGAWLQAAMESPPPNMAVVVKIEDGQVSEVARLWELERDRNPDGFVVESHPFGIAAAPGNRLVVAEAGGNTLLSLNPNTGRMGVVAVFAGVPVDVANPNRGDANEADPVPTGVTFDADGNAYVSFLVGVPFTPGAAKVVKISADGATVSDYASGLTSLIDIRSGPDGQLYAVQFAQFGEEGPAPDSGAIIRVKEGDASEVVLSGLSYPSSLDISPDGDGYVTINGVGAPGSGAVVKYAGLTSMAGVTLTYAMSETHAMTDSMAAPAGDQPSVTVSDQESDGKSVTVANTMAAVDGWMVIHLDEDDKPGPVLGQSQVMAGANHNIVVILDPPLEGETKLWAMLHVDGGAAGVYEFPGSDGPVVIDGAVVMTPFTAMMTTMSADDQAAAPEVLPQTGGGLEGAALYSLLAIALAAAGVAAGWWVRQCAAVLR
jgi:sugar lactone lactonase YvrE